MSQPMPHSMSHSRLVEDIRAGRIVLPRFQREFVWDIGASAKLLDSIIKNYPVGTFVIWKTKDRLASIRRIGNMDLPGPVDGDYTWLVLDGQQRITSLLAALEGAVIGSDASKHDFKKIMVDLDANDDEPIVMVRHNNTPHVTVKLNQLINPASILSTHEFDQKYFQKIIDYSRIIQSYNYSVIEIGDVPIDTATEIFTRLNVEGQALNLFQIMSAKTYDENKKFDMSEKFNEFIADVEDVGYETLPSSLILQIISLVHKSECKRKTILALSKNEIINAWDKVIDALKMSIDYFRYFYHIPASGLLPYPSLIVLFAYFFYHHKNKPSSTRRKYLDDFFYRIALSGRYSYQVESKLAQDAKRIDHILNNQLPNYDWGLDTTPRFIIDNGKFHVAKSYIKAILCIYARQGPKSFDNGSAVDINNASLKSANSKNYHHFFPLKYLTELDISKSIANHILNITIVDGYLNKNKIKSKPPSKYMNEFKTQNPDLDLPEIMRTHLIDDLDGFGVWSDDYDKFITSRAERLSREIESLIIPQDRTLAT